VDNLAVDVVFSLITAIPFRDYGDKADPEFSKVAILSAPRAIAITAIICSEGLAYSKSARPNPSR
jgi:hypothetical protein